MQAELEEDWGNVIWEAFLAGRERAERQAVSEAEAELEHEPAGIVSAAAGSEEPAGGSQGFGYGQ